MQAIIVARGLPEMSFFEIIKRMLDVRAKVVRDERHVRAEKFEPCLLVVELSERCARQEQTYREYGHVPSTRTWPLRIPRPNSNN